MLKKTLNLRETISATVIKVLAENAVKVERNNMKMHINQ